MPVITGKNLLLKGTVDSGVTFLPFAGMREATLTRDNPTEETTSQSDFADCDMHNSSTGRSGTSISGTGVVDNTTSSALTLYKTLVNAANSDTPELQMEFVEANVGTWESTWLISTFEVGKTETSVITFTASFINKDVVTFTPVG